MRIVAAAAASRPPAGRYTPGVAGPGRVIYENPFTIFSLDEARGLVWMERTREPLPDADLLRAQLAEITALLDRLDLSQLGLVIDSRAPVGRNDPAFEAMMQEFTGTMTRRFPRIAVLIRSAVGRLQAQRLARQDPSWRPLLVTEDVDAAIRHARGER